MKELISSVGVLDFASELFVSVERWTRGSHTPPRRVWILGIKDPLPDMESRNKVTVGIWLTTPYFPCFFL